MEILTLHQNRICLNGLWTSYKLIPYPTEEVKKGSPLSLFLLYKRGILYLFKIIPNVIAQFKYLFARRTSNDHEFHAGKPNRKLSKCDNN